MNTQANTPENPKPSEEETIAERSARLEAEAAAMANPEPYEETGDPLAPEEIPEEAEQAAEEESYNDEQSAIIIKSLQDELDTMKDQAARALAEAENTRRRARKEREDAGKYAISGFAKDLLDVSDNLRRALDAIPEDMLESEPRLKNLVDGIEATERTLLKSFDKNGIEKLEPLDEPFNPNFHEVMFEAPVPGKAAGLVMQVVEPGYILNGRILRPARVGVTKDDGSGGGDTPPPPAGGHLDTEA